MDALNGNQAVLAVRGLRTYFDTEDGIVNAVNGVDLTINRGEVLGLVGESGSGKSVTSLSIMRLIGYPGRISAGEIFFNGEDLLTLSDANMRNIRGNFISMIFQQPTGSLNPVFRIGDQVAEAIRIHQRVDEKEANARAIEMLRKVGIPSPERRARAFPHEISGGQAQRVMIAMALACNPQLLIADEPTTALDVTIQAQILDLMRHLRDEMGTAILLITHDLGVVAEMADSVAVMYAGRIVEYAEVVRLFKSPAHPYTEGLLASIPVLGEVKDQLAVIPGSVPNLVDLPEALCHFAPRCPYQPGHPICVEQKPPLHEVAAGHWVRCWRWVPETKDQWADSPANVFAEGAIHE
ncbi:MAG: ABC transporter ATP-binding protein [Anaerolineales bacterium]|nr:ABC transporter ATP-binding protein [Anaerolineales bacterium]MCB9128582.1 ABC transporter ATP-binding protein [Ardenticatenales bacterium]